MLAPVLIARRTGREQIFPAVRQPPIARVTRILGYAALGSEMLNVHIVSHLVFAICTLIMKEDAER
jgi:hypothetical protein